MLLENKNIIITGGASGSGAATAIEAAREGANVVTMSRAAATDARAVKVIEECSKAGKGKYKHIQLDVSNRENVFKAFDEAVEFFGGELHGLVTGHAIDGHTSSAEVEEDEMLSILKVNLLGTVYADQAAYKYMTGKGGSIVNYASVSGVMGIDGMPAYSMSKGGVVSFSRLIAREWGPEQIRVNMLLPVVWSNLAEIGNAAIKDDPDAVAGFAKWLDDTIHLRRGISGIKEKYGSVEDAAYMTVFLLSDKAGYVTGQMIGVDGGMTFPR